MRASLSAVAGATRAVLGLVVMLAAVAAIALARTGSFDPYSAVGAVNPAVAALSADQLKAAAADKLETVTDKGGGGYAFEIVQTSTITAKPGGPLIDIPSPTNAYEIIGQADEYPLNTMLEAGVVTPDGFWSELRAWPVTGAYNAATTAGKAGLPTSTTDAVGNVTTYTYDALGRQLTEVLPGDTSIPALSRTNTYDERN